MGLDIEGGGESAVANRVSSSSQKEARQQLTVLNATIAVDCAAHMLNLQCINAPKALNCFSVNITCNGLPMMIKVDYSKLTANEKRDKKNMALILITVENDFFIIND